MKKLPVTKSLLFDKTAEIISNKSDGQGVTSAEVVDEILRNPEELPKEETELIMRHGLMVLAGRVTSMNHSSPDQSDMFIENGLPLFADLRVQQSDGRYKTKRFDVRRLTPNQILAHKPAARKNSGKSKREKLIEWADKQAKNGFGEKAINEFS